MVMANSNQAERQNLKINRFLLSYLHISPVLKLNLSSAKLPAVSSIAKNYCRKSDYDTSLIKVNFWKFPMLFIPKVHAAERDDDKLNLRLSDYKQRIRSEFSHETGYDRLRRMFSKNEYGLLSPELLYVIKGSYTCGLFAAAYGGIRSMNQARENFLRQTVATPFESDYLARRQLTDKMTLGALQGGIKYGLKIGSFGSAYLLFTITAATYNNKITIFEHIAAGALFGGLSRINYGLKGIAVAGSLGCFLGLVSGGIIVLSMKLSGISYDELRYWQHETYWEDFYNDSLKRSRKQTEE